jgi:nitrogen regulatory protein PII-like uncharacterized protein
MITLKHIEIYMSYGGDGDGFVRFATKEEKNIMAYKHWYLIENLIQEICLVKNGLVSEEYSKKIKEQLKENCDSERTITKLEEIADER